MKYIISKEQQEMVSNAISNLVKLHFSESTWICDIVVYPTETDEDEALFDIYVYLKLSELKKYNESAQNSISLTIRHKVQDFVEDWFSFKSEQIYVGSLAKDC